MKVVNFVLGLATAVILGALINLGIKAFYPEPVMPNYPNYPVAMPCTSNDVPCQKTQAELSNQQQAKWSQDQLVYTGQMNVYNKDLFIIANVIGIIMFALGFWLIFGGIALASNAVPVGIMLAGLWSIIYGYGRGWGSIDDQLKFFIGLVIAVLVIGGSVWLMQRYQKNHPHNA